MQNNPTTWKSKGGSHDGTVIQLKSKQTYGIHTTDMKNPPFNSLVWGSPRFASTRQFGISDTTYACGHNGGGHTVKWWLVLPWLACPQWPLPLIVPPPHAHDPPGMHTSLLSSHPGVGKQQQELTQMIKVLELIPTGFKQWLNASQKCKPQNHSCSFHSQWE